MKTNEPDPQDIQDILNHQPFLWMFKRDGRSKIHHYTKGEWGEIRWDFGFICGFVMGIPIWLIAMMILMAK